MEAPQVTPLLPNAHLTKGQLVQRNKTEGIYTAQSQYTRNKNMQEGKKSNEYINATTNVMDYS